MPTMGRDRLSWDDAGEPNEEAEPCGVTAPAGLAVQ